MTIAFNPGFANNINDTLSRKVVSSKTTVSPFRDFLATTGATAQEKTSPVIDSVSGKAGVTKEMPLPFLDSLTALAANSVEKTNQVSSSTADKAAEFDPFSVVRSGAVPEDNAFVMALKRFYGMVVDPAPLPQIPSAVTLGTTPVQIENVQASQASMGLPPTTDPSPEPITGLSQLISNAVEQSAATTANQEVIDTVLNRLS
jgi:uncharacterized protein (DUF697 family)